MIQKWPCFPKRHSNKIETAVSSIYVPNFFHDTLSSDSHGLSTLLSTSVAVLYLEKLTIAKIKLIQYIEPYIKKFLCMLLMFLMKLCILREMRNTTGRKKNFFFMLKPFLPVKAIKSAESKHSIRKESH